MSAKSAMKNRFKNRDDVKLVEVPESMRPTQESIEEMGRQISAQIRSNNAMRYRSMINASECICCKGE